MNILITGATGYLGYHFAKMVLKEGHRVLCLRRSSSVSLFEPEEEKYVQWVNNEDNAKLCALGWNLEYSLMDGIGQIIEDIKSVNKKKA